MADNVVATANTPYNSAVFFIGLPPPPRETTTGPLLRHRFRQWRIHGHAAVTGLGAALKTSGSRGLSSREYGNRWAATVMFVLGRVRAEGKSCRYLMSALGPGFSVGFLTLKIP